MLMIEEMKLESEYPGIASMILIVAPVSK